MTEIACGSVISPALTKPIAMTVVAELLCRTAVTSAPASAPIIGFFVKKLRIFFMRSPAVFCRASLIVFMPYRKSAKPPIRPKQIFTVSFIPCSSQGNTDSIVLRCNQHFLTYMNPLRNESCL